LTQPPRGEQSAAAAAWCGSSSGLAEGLLVQPSSWLPERAVHSDGGAGSGGSRAAAQGAGTSHAPPLRPVPGDGLWRQGEQPPPGASPSPAAGEPLGNAGTCQASSPCCSPPAGSGVGSGGEQEEGRRELGGASSPAGAGVRSPTGGVAAGVRGSGEKQAALLQRLKAASQGWSRRTGSSSSVQVPAASPPAAAAPAPAAAVGGKAWSSSGGSSAVGGDDPGSQPAAASTARVGPGAAGVAAELARGQPHGSPQQGDSPAQQHHHQHKPHLHTPAMSQHQLPSHNQQQHAWQQPLQVRGQGQDQGQGQNQGQGQQHSQAHRRSSADSMLHGTSFWLLPNHPAASANHLPPAGAGAAAASVGSGLPAGSSSLMTSQPLPSGGSPAALLSRGISPLSAATPAAASPISAPPSKPSSASGSFRADGAAPAHSQFSAAAGPKSWSQAGLQGPGAEVAHAQMLRSAQALQGAMQMMQTARERVLGRSPGASAAQPPKPAPGPVDAAAQQESTSIADQCKDEPRPRFAIPRPAVHSNDGRAQCDQSRAPQRPARIATEPADRDVAPRNGGSEQRVGGPGKVGPAPRPSAYFGGATTTDDRLAATKTHIANLLAALSNADASLAVDAQ
ncbi:hypothetical protein V8C86DRAFT_2455219, partial [Haematococcus lacustris]